MKTLKTYLVRKPSDLGEVQDLTRKYQVEAEAVKVAETIELAPAKYAEICLHPLGDYAFFSWQRWIRG